MTNIWLTYIFNRKQFIKCLKLFNKAALKFRSEKKIDLLKTEMAKLENVIQITIVKINYFKTIVLIPFSLSFSITSFNSLSLKLLYSTPTFSSLSFNNS